MIIKKILNWIQVNYFSGNINVLYKTETQKNWNELCAIFRHELDKPKQKYSELFIGFSDNSIIIQKQTNSGLRWPSDVFHLEAEVSLENQYLVVNIHVYLGEYFNFFFPIWRGFVFIFSLIVLGAFLLNHGNSHDIKTPVVFGFGLLIFNAVCWLATYYFTLEAKTLFNYIQRTIDKSKI